ncbi:MAG: J domain-containing protein [Chloroflexota bacterium]|nr:J domain-containing protein [Chloroflexota bacterium]
MEHWVVDSASTPDFYSVLQVDPRADQEIIEAAYRQLMKKHHPDVAGTDARLAAQHHQRAKLINQAHTVLGDPVRRQRYDAARASAGGVATPPRPPGADPSNFEDSRAANGAASVEWEAGQAAPAWTAVRELKTPGEVRGPFSMALAAYYLLPGPYEWEGGRGRDLLATCLLPPVGIAAYALATGRLAWLVGHSIGAAIVAWGVLFLLTMPSWSALPRLAMASLPSVVMMSGAANLVLAQVGVPTWLAWVTVGFVSLLLSARLYVFAVLPTLGACWMLGRLGL